MSEPTLEGWDLDDGTAIAYPVTGLLLTIWANSPDGMWHRLPLFGMRWKSPAWWVRVALAWWRSEVPMRVKLGAAKTLLRHHRKFAAG